eukprot:3586674-Pleurochrysis_carterae.AAC.1
MIWTVVGGRHTAAAWHVARIASVLAPGCSNTFTHDAVFTAERRHLPRGVSLSAEAYAEGCWLPIQQSVAN